MKLHDLGKTILGAGRADAASRIALLAATLLGLALVIAAAAGRYGPALRPAIVAAVTAGLTLAIIRLAERLRQAHPQLAAPPAPVVAAPRGIERHQLVAIDYAFNILGGATPPPDLPPAALAEWRHLRDRGLDRIPLPDELARFFQRHAMLTAQRQELIADYRHYCAHRVHRRPALWAERQSWYRRG